MNDKQERDRSNEEQPDESVAPNSAPNGVTEPTDEGTIPADTRYRWTYADQQAYDAARCAEITSRRKKDGRKGIWVYALIMTVVFALSFGILVAVLAVGKDISVKGGDPQNDAVSRADMQPIEAAKRSTVVIEVLTASGGGTGTGIILNTNGDIATNHHVIDGATSIRVTFLDGTQAEAELIGSSDMDDLAVIRVNSVTYASQLFPATFVESTDDTYVGQTVYAIGAPGGIEFAFTTTKGMVSYVNREVRLYNTDGTLEKKIRAIQTDAKVNPGNSGGPLVATDGRVVGIVSMKLAGDYDGIGFAIPSDGALEILEAIIRDGHANSVNSSLSFRRPLLGIVGVYVEAGHTYVMDDSVGRIVDCEGSTVEAVRDEITQAGGKPGSTIEATVSGVYVTSVTDGMGAVGRLEVGDVILSVDERQVTSMNGLANTLNDHYVGDVVTIRARRNEKTVTVQVELMAQK